MKLKEKVAIVTGGGNGIGREICKGFSKEGAKIVIADLDEENSDKTLNEIKNLGNDGIVINTDISNEDSVNNLILETVKKFNKID